MTVIMPEAGMVLCSAEERMMPGQAMVRVNVESFLRKSGLTIP